MYAPINPVYLGAVGANLRVRPWCEIICRQIKGRHIGLPLQNPV